MSYRELEIISVALRILEHDIEHIPTTRRNFEDPPTVEEMRQLCNDYEERLQAAWERRHEGVEITINQKKREASVEEIVSTELFAQLRELRRKEIQNA